MIYVKEGELLDIKRDIYLLHRHLDLVHRQLELEAAIAQHERKEADEQIAGGELDDDLVAMLEHGVGEHLHWFQELAPQVIINPFIVSLWSLYESVLRDLAHILRRRVGADTDFHEVNGRHFMERIEKYYREVLSYDLGLSDEWRKELRLLCEVRNAIVHGYGKMSSLPKSLRPKASSGTLDGIAIAKDGDKIVLSAQFAERKFEVVREHILTLLKKHQWT